MIDTVALQVKKKKIIQIKCVCTNHLFLANTTNGNSAQASTQSHLGGLRCSTSTKSTKSTKSTGVSWYRTAMSYCTKFSNHITCNSIIQYHKVNQDCDIILIFNR